MTYARIRDLANRAVQYGQLSDPVLPGNFLVWAKRNDFALPTDLVVWVAARGNKIADWKMLYDESQAELKQARAFTVELHNEWCQLRNERDAALSEISELKSQIETLQFANEELGKAKNALVDERDTALANVQQLLSEAESRKPAEKGLGARERETLLRLIIGMAVKGYCYDPKPTRSDKIPEIVHDLKEAGVGLDADTVRKWLKQSAELLPARETE